MKIILCAAVLAVATPAAAAAQAKPAVTKPAVAKPAVKQLYATMCQACHGPDGKAPVKEMGFAARKWKHGTKTADMIKVITNGVPGTAMLPFKGRLTETEIRDLARYVRSLDKKMKPEKKQKPAPAVPLK